MSFINSDIRYNIIELTVSNLYPDKTILNVYYEDLPNLNYSSYYHFFFVKNRIYVGMVFKTHVLIATYKYYRDDKVTSLYLPIGTPLQPLNNLLNMPEAYYGYLMEGDSITDIICTYSLENLTSIKKDIKKRKRENASETSLIKRLFSKLL